MAMTFWPSPCIPSPSLPGREHHVARSSLPELAGNSPEIQFTCRVAQTMQRGALVGSQHTAHGKQVPPRGRYNQAVDQGRARPDLANMNWLQRNGNGPSGRPCNRPALPVQRAQTQHASSHALTMATPILLKRTTERTANCMATVALALATIAAHAHVRNANTKRRSALAQPIREQNVHHMSVCREAPSRPTARRPLEQSGTKPSASRAGRHRQREMSPRTDRGPPAPALLQEAAGLSTPRRPAQRNAARLGRRVSRPLPLSR